MGISKLTPNPPNPTSFTFLCIELSIFVVQPIRIGLDDGSLSFKPNPTQELNKYIIKILIV